jgi:hypothetical protein
VGCFLIQWSLECSYQRFGETWWLHVQGTPVSCLTDRQQVPPELATDILSRLACNLHHKHVKSALLMCVIYYSSCIKQKIDSNGKILHVHFDALMIRIWTRISSLKFESCCRSYLTQATDAHPSLAVRTVAWRPVYFLLVQRRINPVPNCPAVQFALVRSCTEKELQITNKTQILAK